MKTIGLIILTVFSLSGCAGSQTSQLEIKQLQLEALTTGMSKCGNNQGCQVALTAWLFGGGMNVQEEGVVQYAAALLPYANLALTAYNMALGGSGSGGQGVVINRSNNVSLVGFNKNSLKGGGTLNAQFDATSTLSRTQSWENMHNPDKSVTQDK